MIMESIRNVNGMKVTAWHGDAGKSRACTVGKHTRNPQKPCGAKAVDSDATKVLKCVYYDVEAPMKIQSLGKAKYFATLLHKFSGYALVRFLHRKSETAKVGIKMMKELKISLNSKIIQLTSLNRKVMKWVRSDSGGKYVGLEFQKWVRQRGIVYKLTRAYSPESNGNAERLKTFLLDMAQIMMMGAPNIAPNLWAEAFNAA